MDYIGATPMQNPIMGLLADRLKKAQEFAAKPFGYSNPPVEMLMNLLGIPAVQQTAERIAYGEPLTTGKGMTTKPRQEAVEAALTVAPVAGLLGSGANKAAMAAGRAGERYSERVVPQIMERGGLPAQLLRDLNQGSRSNAIELGSEFLGKNPPKIENLARTSDKFLFHSSTADKAKDLKYGVEPQAGGDWVREVASGATDKNLDDFFENVTPLAWFSDKPEWIKAMVGRKLNKPFDKVTAKDIEEHGHLAFINKKSPEAENITYIPEQGLMEGSQSVVYDINKANPRKAWETGLYQEGNYGSRLEPFGVERNEYVSPESVEPLLQLTGPELVQFMRLKGLLETAQPKFNVTSADASDIFGAGAKRVRYQDPASNGFIDVLQKPDGTASVLGLEVPEVSRGKGIGQSLQQQVLQDFPEMQGQVSSKAAAKTAYRLGRRPPGQPEATLDDVYRLMDENSSVNLVSPEMQKRFLGLLE